MERKLDPRVVIAGSNNRPDIAHCPVRNRTSSARCVWIVHRSLKPYDYGSTGGLFGAQLKAQVYTFGAMLLLLTWSSRVSSQDLGGHSFVTPNSVEGTLAGTANRQRQGVLENYDSWKEQLERRSGLTFGFDTQLQYLDANTAASPSDAAGNVLRFYGAWTATGRNTPNNGALVFRVENRSAVGSNIPPQALGPALGYAGLLSSTYSDADWVLTNLLWRQRLHDGRISYVIGQVDITDYLDTNSLASPWDAFGNLAFEMPTIPAPGQGLGAAILSRINESWAVLGGVVNANGDAADPIDSAEALFNSGETFKHLAIAWSPDWGDRFNQAIQFTLWQVDEREDAAVESGHGVAIAASARAGNWRPFFRAGYGDGGGPFMGRALSMGAGYDARRGKDLAGLGLNWGRAPENTRDQYTLEAFYRYGPTDFFLVKSVNQRLHLTLSLTKRTQVSKVFT